jgi:hypothetical protein
MIFPPAICMDIRYFIGVFTGTIGKHDTNEGYKPKDSDRRYITGQFAASGYLI